MFLLGAPSFDNGQTDEGKLFAYYGSSSGLPAISDYSVIEGNQTGAQLGSSVSSAGDVNGDGYSDILIGVPFFDLGQSDEGLVYLDLRNTGRFGIRSWLVSSEQSNRCTVWKQSCNSR
jgi:hypothetical protein